MSTKESVAAMAYSTGVRIKSSAVELFRGLESSLQSREQFEITLAKIFGSCTGDFKHNRDEPLDSFQSRSESSMSYSENNDRRTLGAAPLRRDISNTSSRRMTASGTKNSISSRKKRSSNNSANSVSSRSSAGSDLESRGHSPRRREGRQSQADYGEHIYAQLFMDDQRRAEQAISTLRETAVARAPPAATIAPQHAITKPFPMSSPPRGDVKIAPLSSNDLHIPANATFDDGISAISQHTLEAMADRVNRSRSSDSSLFSFARDSKSKTPPPVLATPNRKSPIQMMPRVRSAQSKSSRQSNKTRSSKTSHTTHTSDTSSFQNMWQQEEQRYWNTQVEQDSRKSRKSKNESVGKTVGTMNTSLESSFSDVWGSPLRHPHESSFLAKDPDRIGAVFVVPHTEMAEI